MEVQWDRERLSDLERTFHRLQEDAQQCQTLLKDAVQSPLVSGFQGPAGTEYQARLQTEIERIETIKNHLESMAEALKKVQNNYEECENRIRSVLPTSSGGGNGFGALIQGVEGIKGIFKR